MEISSTISGSIEIKEGELVSTDPDCRLADPSTRHGAGTERSLLWMSLEIKEQRRKRQEDERRRQEWEKKRWEKFELIRKEEERLKELNEEVDLWNRSQILRAYIDKVREQAVAEHGEIDENSKLGRWLAWAMQQADRVDPLVESPPSILDEKGKWEYGWYR